MAKFSKSITYKNAVIDLEKDLITENPSKDVINFYKLSKVFEDWNGIEGITITIKKDDDIKSDGEDE